MGKKGRPRKARKWKKAESSQRPEGRGREGGEGGPRERALHSRRNVRLISIRFARFA